MLKNTLRFAFGICLVVIAGCDKNPPKPQPVPPVDTTDTTIIPAKYTRDSAIKDYNSMYVATELSSGGWTGNTATCDPGTVPQSVHDAVIKRINYFRKIVGLNYDCTLDASLITAQQKTALMMTAAGDLSHDPGTSWPCYTADGADGAKKSNLRLGSAATDAVTAFMNDEEEYNQDVGHRRWLLYAKQSAFSHGSTDNVGIVHVLVKAENTKIPDFIAYPPANFIPRPIVFNRWSFSIPGADFAGATVTMEHKGVNIPVNIVSKTTKVADNTIVWEPQTTIPDSPDDLTYKVTVSGIGAAKQTSYTYDVVVIKP